MSTSTFDKVAYVFGAVGALYVLNALLTFIWGIFKHFLRRETNLYQRYGGCATSSKSSKSWVAVTGATGALGFSYCKEFAKRGFNVLIIARNENKANNSKTQLLKLYPNIECDIFKCDLSKLADNDTINQVKTAFENSVLMRKDIAILVNNAALGLESRQFTDFDVLRNVSMMKVNMFPCIVLSQILIDYFKERNLKYHKKSCIINVSSAAASMTLPGFSVYGASKAFMKYWSIAASKEFEKDNIDIMVTLPGQMASEMSGFKVNPFLGTISTDKYANGTMKHIGKNNRSISDWFGHAFFAHMMSSLPMELLLIMGEKILFPFIKSIETETRKEDDAENNNTDDYNNGGIRKQIYTSKNKSFSISRGIQIQKTGVDLMKQETPLLFIWTNLTILLCVVGSIVMMAIGGVLSKTITPIIILCNIPLEVFSFALVSSKYGFSGIMRFIRGISWIPSWIFIIIDFVDSNYDDINDNTKSDIYFVYIICFVVLNGVLSIYDLIKFFGWLFGSREEIVDTGFFDVNIDCSVAADIVNGGSNGGNGNNVNNDTYVSPEPAPAGGIRSIQLSMGDTDVDA